MTRPTARMVMALALALMRDQDRRWAQAMALEFEQAGQDGHGLRFAWGCTTVALRRLTGSSAGWHLLVRHAVAVAVLLPMALFHLGCAMHGLRCWALDRDPYLAALEAGDAGQRVIAIAYRTWSPPILLGLVLLGGLHILIAWRIAASDWHRARRGMIAAALVVAGLLACIAAIHPTAWGMMLQGVALAAEMLAVPILAAWQARSASPAAP